MRVLAWIVLAGVALGAPVPDEASTAAPDNSLSEAITPKPSAVIEQPLAQGPQLSNNPESLDEQEVLLKQIFGEVFQYDPHQPPSEDLIILHADADEFAGGYPDSDPNVYAHVNADKDAGDNPNSDANSYAHVNADKDADAVGGDDFQYDPHLPPAEDLVILHADAGGNPDSDANVYAHVNTDKDTDAAAAADIHLNVDSDAHIDADKNADADANTDTDIDVDTAADVNSDADEDAGVYEDEDEDSILLEGFAVYFFLAELFQRLID